MGAVKEGKMEENSLNKYNRSPPSPPILLPSSEIRYLLCVLQHSPNRERTNLLLRTPSVFFLFLVTLLLTDFHTNLPILIFRFCTCVLFYLLFFFNSNPFKVSFANFYALVGFLGQNIRRDVNFFYCAYAQLCE